MRTDVTPKTRDIYKTFLTTEQITIMWRESRTWRQNFRIMLGFCIVAGKRISEIRAINLVDFSNGNLAQLQFILSKSHIMDDFPIIEEFQQILQKYINENMHRFRDGYLFPKVNYYDPDEPYINERTASDMFWKFKKRILIPKYPWADKKGLAWHACRRWFETELWEKNVSPEEIAHIQRYKKVETVYTYLNEYITLKKRSKILNEVIGPVFKKMNNYAIGQKELKEFF